MAENGRILFPIRKAKGKIEFSKCEKGIGSENHNSLFSPKKRKTACDDYDSNFINAKENISSNERYSVSQSVKQAFHTGMPERLIGRQEEMGEIFSFLTNHLSNKKSGSLYISGAPGTGKTCSVKYVLNTCKFKFNTVFINCMSTSSSRIYKAIACKLGLLKSSAPSKCTLKVIEEFLTRSETMTVLILDELDHLDSKGQEVLYSLFSLPQLHLSSVILIGIANSLDLTDRILPRLHSFNYEPVLLHFQPYSAEQIALIIGDRLSSVKSDISVIQPVAIQLCARKVAASSGDVRKAIDVCKRAFEISDNRGKQQVALKPVANQCNTTSPKKSPAGFQTVGVQQINNVLCEIYGSRIQSCVNAKSVTLPLQQALILCTIVLMKKFCKDFSLGKVYEVYRRICRKRQISEVDEGNFYNLCQLMQLRNFIELKKNKVFRMSKINLAIDESEVEHVLVDKNLLAAVLADRSIIENKCQKN